MSPTMRPEFRNAQEAYVAGRASAYREIVQSNDALTDALRREQKLAGRVDLVERDLRRWICACGALLGVAFLLLWFAMVCWDYAHGRA